MPKTLYVAGPMTGYPDSNYPAFRDAATHLREVGYTVLNPVDNKPDVEGDPTWLDFMRMSLVQIAQADGIAVLPAWDQSRGAKLEVEIAQRLGLEVGTVEAWLFLPPGLTFAEAAAAVAEAQP